jgi:hypothetical protein
MQTIFILHFHGFFSDGLSIIFVFYMNTIITTG